MTDTVAVRMQDSLVPAVLNAIINGGIAWAGFKAAEAVPLTLDLISAQQHTVWGQGVTLAFALGVILTLVTSKVFARHVAKSHPALAKRVQRPLFPFVAGVALGNGMALFGWFVALAVIWQRVVGTVEVSPVTASVLVGLLAGVITIAVEMRTKRALLRSPA